MYWNYKEGPLDILMNILYFARFQVWTFNLEMYFEEGYPQLLRTMKPFEHKSHKSCEANIILIELSIYHGNKIVQAKNICERWCLDSLIILPLSSDSLNISFYRKL